MKHSLEVKSQSIEASGITKDYKEALVEYIWNGFEANATQVEVSYIPNDLGGLSEIGICITKISTFLILCDLAVCLATLYVSFSLVFALMRYLQGKVFLIRFYSPTTLSSSRAEFRLPSRLACA